MKKRHGKCTPMARSLWPEDSIATGTEKEAVIVRGPRRDPRHTQAHCVDVTCKAAARKVNLAGAVRVLPVLHLNSAIELTMVPGTQVSQLWSKGMGELAGPATCLPRVSVAVEVMVTPHHPTCPLPPAAVGERWPRGYESGRAGLAPQQLQH